MHVDAMTVATERRRFLACLSDPSRFSLVTMLADGPRCVTELASLVGLSQSCTTRHLQALLRESIVVAERRGKRVVYALRREGRDVHPVLRWACEPVEGRPEGGVPNPIRSRRRPLADPLQLEPDPVTVAAVEHESGWVEADAVFAPSDGAIRIVDSDPVHDAQDLTTPEDGTIPARPELDDFLL